MKTIKLKTAAFLIGLVMMASNGFSQTWTTNGSGDVYNNNSSGKVAIGISTAASTGELLTLGGSSGQIRFKGTYSGGWIGDSGAVMGMTSTHYMYLIGGPSGLVLSGDPHAPDTNTVWLAGNGSYKGNVGIGTKTPSYKLQVNGSAYFSKAYCLNGSWSGSDKRFKRDITKLESATDKLKKLNGYTYYFETEKFKDKQFSKDQQIGLIAQEVKEVFPQLVTTDAEGFYAVNYQGMVPVLLEAIKEQQKQIEELKAIVLANNSTNTNIPSTNRIAVNLSDKDVVVLNQNQPNPFAEQTVINYNIPQNANNAQILFYDLNGKQINSVTITNKGQGQLSVYANDLTNGVYNYTLIVDGKVIETKKMMKQ